MTSADGRAYVKKRALAFTCLFGLGTLGVLTLFPGLEAPVAALRASGKAPPVGDFALRLLLLVQPTLLVAIAAAIGLATARPVRLRSLIVDRIWSVAPPVDLGWKARQSVGLGVTAGSIIVVGDFLLSPWTAGSLEPIRVPAAGYDQALMLGLFYGGLTEEILMRWGLMSFLAWGLYRMQVRLSLSLVISVVVTSIIFGLSHLPALAALTELTDALVLRTMLLNVLAGCVFGLVFVRYGLEFAMLAHATAHIIIFFGRLAGLAY